MAFLVYTTILLQTKFGCSKSKIIPGFDTYRPSLLNRALTDFELLMYVRLQHLNAQNVLLISVVMLTIPRGNR